MATLSNPSILASQCGLVQKFFKPERHQDHGISDLSEVREDREDKVSTDPVPRTLLSPLLNTALSILTAARRGDLSSAKLSELSKVAQLGSS